MANLSNPRAPFAMTSEHQPLAPPGGKPLIVHVIVNIEYWAYDQPTPRTIVTPPHGRSNIPDLPNFCWSEYGNRAGMPRLLELFRSRSIPVSASINASVIDVYPSLARAVREAGWEFVGHGVHQRSLAAENDEAAQIKCALDTLEAFTGKRPIGWMSPGWSETFDTLDHLRSNGVEYVCQWVIDDVPTQLTTKYGPVVALPLRTRPQRQRDIRHREALIVRNALAYRGNDPDLRARDCNSGAAEGADNSAPPASFRYAASHQSSCSRHRRARRTRRYRVYEREPDP